MKKYLKKGFSLIELLVVIAVVAIIAAVAIPTFAADLEYTTLPQTGDSDLVRDNKAAVAVAKMEYGNTFLNTATNGTFNIAGPVVLDRVIVGTAGATSTLVLSEVTASATNVIATASTTAQNTLQLGVRVSGTLRAVAAGGTPANLTLSYR